MIVEDGKIIEATAKELYNRWLMDDWGEFVSFPNFLQYMKDGGTTVTEEKGYGKADG